MKRIVCLAAVVVVCAIGSRAQTISELTYTATDTTIVGTWTTDVAAKSSITCSGKNGVDNGVAASSMSHQAIVAGLAPSTTYSCTVTSGATTSSPEDVVTKEAAVREVFMSVKFGVPKRLTNHGDTNYTFVSNNDRTYITDCDGFGFFPGMANAGANMQVDILTNEQNFVGATVNLLQNYGKADTSTGSDGPGGAALSNKVTGIFGMSGNLYVFATRQISNGGAWYNNVIKSRDHGKTWNNWHTPASYNPLGSPQGPQNASQPFPLASKTYGFVTPILYGPDDGTLTPEYQTTWTLRSGPPKRRLQLALAVPGLPVSGCSTTTAGQTGQKLLSDPLTEDSLGKKAGRKIEGA
jgi:hypothetical protein